MLEGSLSDFLALRDREGRILAGGSQHDHAVGPLLFEVGHHFFIDTLVELEILVASCCGRNPKQALAIGSSGSFRAAWCRARDCRRAHCSKKGPTCAFHGSTPLSRVGQTILNPNRPVNK